MTKKAVVLLLAMLLLSGLGFGSLSRERAQPHGQSFSISAHGTLLELFDADGKSRFGKIARDGFDVHYKTQGTKSASAIGSKPTGLQAGPEQPDGQSATATVKTADNALQITSNFRLDESGKELIIVRRFSNLSNNPITLQSVQDYVDSKILVGGQLASDPSAELRQAAMRRVRAKRFSGLSDCNVEIWKCPVDPICPRCPRSDFRPQLFAEQKGIILKWPSPVTLAPRPQKAHATVALQSASASDVSIVVHVVLK